MRRTTTLLLVLMVATSCSIRRGNNSARYRLSEFSSILEENYFEPIDMNPIVDSAIVSMVRQLDPYSRYINQEEVRDWKRHIQGKFYGLGITSATIRDTLMVLATTAHSSASKAGIKPFDRIVAVNGNDIVSIPTEERRKQLRGKQGDKIDLQIVRPFVSDSTLTIELEYRAITEESVTASFMLNDTTGYVKIESFTERTFGEFRDAYTKMNHPTNLVIDLRDNSGGLTKQAYLLAGFFLPKGSLIYSMEGRTIKPIKLETTKDGEFLDGKVVVMLNEMSASSSELVAGALQDWDRALIIGRRSFGKGVVQRQFNLSNGSCANITIARYHTPSGRVIQRGMQIDSTSRYKTLRYGRKVYGGGGITPDVCIEKNSNSKSEELYIALTPSIIPYIDNRKTEISSYSSSESFAQNFEVDMEYLMSQIENRDQYSQSDIDTTQSKLKQLMIELLYSNEAAAIFESSHKSDYFTELYNLLGNWEDYTNRIFNE